MARIKRKIGIPEALTRLHFLHGRMGMAMIDGNGGDHAWIDLATPYDRTSNPTLSLGSRLPWGKRAAVTVAVGREGVAWPSTERHSSTGKAARPNSS